MQKEKKQLLHLMESLSDEMNVLVCMTFLETKFGSVCHEAYDLRHR